MQLVKIKHLKLTCSSSFSNDTNSIFNVDCDVTWLPKVDYFWVYHKTKKQAVVYTRAQIVFFLPEDPTIPEFFYKDESVSVEKPKK